MTRPGHLPARKEYGPRGLVGQARLADEAGCPALWLSDRFHPRLDEQGRSPSVWSLVGALGEATPCP